MKLDVWIGIVAFCCSSIAWADSSSGTYRLNTGAPVEITADGRLLAPCDSQDAKFVSDMKSVEISYKGSRAQVNGLSWKVVLTSGDKVVIRKDEHKDYLVEIVFYRGAGTSAAGSIRHYGLDQRGNFVCATARPLTGRYSP